jgi:putative ABC transport system permease protein
LVTKLVLENLKHRPIRTFLTVIAIGLQVTLVLTIVGLSRGMIEAAKIRNRGVGADILVRPPGAAIIGMSGAPMPEGVVALLEKQPHVALAQGVVLHPIGGLESITGIDLDRFSKMSGGLEYIKGGPFQQPDDILVDENFANQRKVSVGDTVQLANHDWHVRGIVGPGKLSKVFAQKKVLQDLTSNTGKISMVYVKVDDQANLGPAIQQLKGLLEGYQIYSMEEFLSLITDPASFPRS